MAFDATEMKRIAGASESFYTYRTADAIATVGASGYFNNHADSIRYGDIIKAFDTNNNTLGELVVTSANLATPVTTATT
jgi:hypothetical protein